MQHPTEKDRNPYSPSDSEDERELSKTRTNQHRGPLIYFVLAGVISAALAIPLIVPMSLSVNDDPNPIGYLLILFSFPIGGLIYRIRSRKWPIDGTVRNRQRIACFVTLMLPIGLAFLTGMRAQGFHMTIVGAIVSLVLIVGILVSGQRRARSLV